MSNVLKELEEQIEITENVLKPFLGKCFVHVPLIVFLTAEEIKLLIETFNRFRPAHRKHQSLEPKSTYGSLLPDFCCLPQSLKLMPSEGPVLSIEIKPKQGFMKEEYFPGSSSTLPIPMCRCCMMKSYKLKKGDITFKSEYCPTDLFSGCYTRMLHAIKMLCKTPQNNFRIFKDQRLVYSEEKKDNLNDVLSEFIVSDQIGTTDLFYDLLIEVLIKPFPDKTHKTPFTVQNKFSLNCINALSVCENDCCHELPMYCVLERILNCQLLDNLTISSVYPLFQKIVQNMDKCSTYIGCYSKAKVPPHIGEPERNQDESEYEYASRKVWEFLIALTLKDCSIMVVLRQLINSSIDTTIPNVISDKKGHLYIFSIALADLDVKTFDKVEKVYNDMCLIRALFDS